MTVPERIVARILSRTSITDEGCWQWTRALTSGYGQIGWHEGGVPFHGLTHRIIYEALVGQVPDGLALDHLCHDPASCKPVRAVDCPHRSCCNPEHLQPATLGANVMRGGGFPPENAAKTHCPQGHRYDDTNTYVASNGWRQCRTCRTEHVRAFRERAAS